MSRLVIDDRMWSKLQTLLPPKPKGGRPSKNDRLFIEAVCWILRTGSPWRDLPTSYGNWKTIYNRYHRWAHKGYMTNLLNVLKKRWRSRMAFS